mmetsp:Transcript_36109/g.115938  ORF Transcript_36109/g.115938 Transcript_36109/m.115938 type:complete len:296 (+) Transcript_36109:1791-2678(+)|eukprot:scaffold7024_cov110-Isochrysis_galbana.AAC.4
MCVGGAVAPRQLLAAKQRTRPLDLGQLSPDGLGRVGAATPRVHLHFVRHAARKVDEHLRHPPRPQRVIRAVVPRVRLDQQRKGQLPRVDARAGKGTTGRSWDPVVSDDRLPAVPVPEPRGQDAAPRVVAGHEAALEQIGRLRENGQSPQQPAAHTGAAARGALPPNDERPKLIERRQHSLGADWRQLPPGCQFARPQPLNLDPPAAVTWRLHVADDPVDRCVLVKHDALLVERAEKCRYGHSPGRPHAAKAVALAFGWASRSCTGCADRRGRRGLQVPLLFLHLEAERRLGPRER